MTSYAGSMKSTTGFLVRQPGRAPRHATDYELHSMPVRVEFDGPTGRHRLHTAGLEAARQLAMKELAHAALSPADPSLLAIRSASGEEAVAHIVTCGYFHDIRVEPNGETHC